MPSAKKTKKPTAPTFSFRLEDADRAQLEKEAEAEKRTLASYLRWLIDTHPKRQQPPKKP